MVIVIADDRYGLQPASAAEDFQSAPAPDFAAAWEPKEVGNCRRQIDGFDAIVFALVDLIAAARKAERTFTAELPAAEHPAYSHAGRRKRKGYKRAGCGGIKLYGGKANATTSPVRVGCAMSAVLLVPLGNIARFSFVYTRSITFQPSGIPSRSSTFGSDNFSKASMMAPITAGASVAVTWVVPAAGRVSAGQIQGKSEPYRQPSRLWLCRWSHQQPGGSWRSAAGQASQDPPAPCWHRWPGIAGQSRVRGSDVAVNFGSADCTKPRVASAPW